MAIVVSDKFVTKTERRKMHGTIKYGIYLKFFSGKNIFSRKM